MKIKIGQVYIEIHIDTERENGRIKIISPIDGKLMASVVLFIDARKVCPVTIQSKTYERGDENAEKSAIS